MALFTGISTGYLFMVLILYSYRRNITIWWEFIQFQKFDTWTEFGILDFFQEWWKLCRI